jgi:cell division septation protein DedD
MIKYLFIFINSIALFFISLFSDGGISISNNIPKNLPPGQEVPIELKIAKGSQSGFAKFQLDLPPGIAVKDINAAGANFSYDDGVAKWVWANLPSESEITIQCALVIEKDAGGAKTIGGKYSYVDGSNAKQVVEMTPVETIVGGEGAAANTGAASTNTASQNTATDNATANNTNTTAANTDVAKTYTTPNSNSEPSGNITVQRTYSKSGDGEYTINLRINKGLTKGFARYSDDLPADISAKGLKTEGASFSVADGKVKFVWVNAPEQEIVEISYVISGVKQTLTLKGEYSYLEQNLSKTYTLPEETITADNTASANTNTTAPTNTEVANTNTTAPTNTEVANTNTTAPTNTETAVNTNTTPAETNTGTAANTNTTAPSDVLTKKEGNVKYMVQIGAFTNSAVNTGRLKRKFGISEKIISEMQGGYSKFMVGDHPEYKNARDHREKVKSGNGVASAFVVAYNSGKRITVQEALMISNQKWFR